MPPICPCSQVSSSLTTDWGCEFRFFKFNEFVVPDQDFAIEVEYNRIYLHDLSDLID